MAAGDVGSRGNGLAGMRDRLFCATKLERRECCEVLAAIPAWAKGNQLLSCLQSLSRVGFEVRLGQGLQEPRVVRVGRKRTGKERDCLVSATELR